MHQGEMFGDAPKSAWQNKSPGKKQELRWTSRPHMENRAESIYVMWHKIFVSRTCGHFVVSMDSDCASGAGQCSLDVGKSSKCTKWCCESAPAPGCQAFIATVVAPVKRMTPMKCFIGCNWRSLTRRERRSDQLRVSTMIRLVEKCPKVKSSSTSCFPRANGVDLRPSNILR
jgi:hypothetical protein